MVNAYFDRVASNGQAVLLIEETNQTVHATISSLPTGAKPGHWLSVTLDGEQVTYASLNQAKTEQMSADVNEQLNRLKSRKSSRFKRRS